MNDGSVGTKPPGYADGTTWDGAPTTDHRQSAHHYYMTTPITDARLDATAEEEAKRQRACEACRALKVRCDRGSDDSPCKRCEKARRECVITQPSRKRQKKSDRRVAELETKVDALTAALQHPSAQHRRPTTSQPATPESATMSHKSSGRGDPPRAERGWTPPPKVPERPRDSTMDGFARRIAAIVSPETSAAMFQRYVTILAPHLPAIIFPAGTRGEQVFRQKPVLYTCILSAASYGVLHPEVSEKLAQEAIGVIAERVVQQGIKSLELIQAMQVLAFWFRPPEKSEQANFYQLCHMAAVMALDIGLGKRFLPAKARRGFGGPTANYAPGPHHQVPQDSDTVEARRAWLTCYYLCASAATVLRRPNLVRWSNYMKECIEVLESHPDAGPSDKLFSQYVKVQRICEDIGLHFFMDDSTANININDPKIGFALTVLERQLQEWKENIPPECRGLGLEFFYHITSLYLHEIVLHLNHNIEDFRIPFTEESLRSVNDTSDPLTQAQIQSVVACQRGAQGALDAFLSYDAETIKALPMFLFFVRCVYAIMVLIKMHVAACTPRSELGKTIQPDSLRVDYYLDRLLTSFQFSRLGREEEWRPLPNVLRILTVLKDFFTKHLEKVARGDMLTRNLLPPQISLPPLPPLNGTCIPPRPAVDSRGMTLRQGDVPPQQQQQQQQLMTPRHHPDGRPQVPIPAPQGVPNGPPTSLHVLSQVAATSENTAGWIPPDWAGIRYPAEIEEKWNPAADFDQQAMDLAMANEQFQIGALEGWGLEGQGGQHW
ncbi:hypothetical protein K470DRAFT_255890 [Piedraia hortae CBS 480.64]|uniref:Zn(2)-C6 fungal-type domain-containing protein n=1 Tax=Piedraia hortae CBS 480.64 TaxID=1314780 RepID=A0A6A7C5S6_9PEZI|nr:hypothetical protein K470DRAFT_255890 [Piedraia hortae CBS 480.64]